MNLWSEEEQILIFLKFMYLPQITSRDEPVLIRVKNWKYVGKIRSFELLEIRWTKKGLLSLIQLRTYSIRNEPASPFYQKRDKLNHVDCPISVQIYRVSEHVFHQQSLFVANDNKKWSRFTWIAVHFRAIRPVVWKRCPLLWQLSFRLKKFYKCHWQRCCFRHAKQLSNFEGVSFLA